jgi:hypothetical protein
VCAQDLEHRLTGCPEVALYATDLHGLDHHARETEGNLLHRGGAGVGVDAVRQNRLVYFTAGAAIVALAQGTWLARCNLMMMMMGRRSVSNRPCDCDHV